MQEAIVLEAASAEERVERVERLFARHTLRFGAVDVGRALGGALRVGALGEFGVSMEVMWFSNCVFFILQETTY